MIKHSFTLMGRPTALIVFLFSLGQLTLSAAAGSSAAVPENGATLYQPHPHFHWKRVTPDQLEDAIKSKSPHSKEGGRR